MNIRELIQKNPVVGYGVVVALLAASAVILYVFVFNQDDGNIKWNTVSTYYDLNTGETFEGKPHPELVAPIPAPSGKDFEGEPAGVVAVMYACGPCATSKQWPGYLQKYTPEGKAEWAKPEGARDLGAALKGLRLRKVDGGPWFTTEAPEFEKMILDLPNRCKAGERMERCTK